MNEFWTQIENWLEENDVNQIYNSLNQGADIEDFENLEELINRTLPQDFKEFYSIHNGQSADADGLIDTEELMSLERIAEEWQVWKDLADKAMFEESDVEADKGIKERWWHQGWIPISYDGSGNHFCLDLSPADGGKKGQIIRLWHDSPERELIAGSFTEWISNYVENLKNDKYVYSEEWSGIILKEDLIQLSIGN